MKKWQPFLRIMLSGALFIVILMGLKSAFGRVRRVRSSSRFERVLSKDLVAALFFARQKKLPKDIRRKTKDMQRELKSVSDSRQYRYAEVTFVSVYTDKEELIGISDQYSIPRPTPDSPVLALFKGGSLVATARGFLRSSDISKMINTYFGQKIAKIRKEKDEDLKRREKRAKIRAYNRAYTYPYWGWGGGWGYPYYGGRWYGPGWGIGWGRGGGCRRCR